MSRIPVATIFYTLLAVLLLFPRSGMSQRSFGVLWEVPDDTEEAITHLDRFEKLKVQYLELREVVSDELWGEIEKRDFRVFIQIPVTYPVVETFAEADSSLVQTYQQFLTAYGDKPVEAIGAFAYGQTHNPSFAQAVEPFTEQLNSAVSVPIYFKGWGNQVQPVDALFDFRINKIDVTPGFQSAPDVGFNPSDAFFYHPSNALKSKLAPLKWFIQETSAHTDAILFFDSHWLLNFVDKHRSAEQILINHASYEDAVFPLPQEELPASHSHSTVVLILFVVWGTVALNYSFNPTYRNSLLRYFLSHKFFIEDVMNRHIRSLVPSFILLLQHSLLGGILLYSMAITYLSTTGVEVFYHYFPTLMVFGTGYLSFFFWGIVFTLSFQTISLSWLYIANRNVGYLSQVSILYSWPFHLNLLIATIMVTLLMAGSNVYLLTISFVAFMAVILLDFTITAYDTGQYLKNHKWVYAVGTFGLYSMLVVVVLTTVLTNGYLLNILDLAVSIS